MTSKTFNLGNKWLDLEVSYESSEQEHPNALLIAAGEALYGSRWQTDLAQALSVNDRTVRRWVAGTESPKASVYGDLVLLCTGRAQALGEMVERLKVLSA